MKIRLLTLLLLMGAFSMTWAQQVEVSAKVADESVAVGKPFALDLTMKVPYGTQVEWNPWVTDTLSAQIDILKRGEVSRTADADSNTIYQQTLTLMTFDTGDIQIPSLHLSPLTAHLSPLTAPITLHVTTIAVDTLQPYRPIVEPIAQPMSMKDVFPWLLGALLLVLAVIGVWFLLKHRKPRVDENGEPVKAPVKPPYNKAIDDLADLRQQKLWQVGKVKEYYSSLSDIAREYIEGQFGVNAVEMTTDDILDEVRGLNFNSQIYGKLKDTMELSDLVKFAKYAPSSLENDNAISDMTDFVNDSYAFDQARQTQDTPVAGEEAQDHV